MMNLEELKNVDIRTVNPDTLVDINKINVNTKLSGEKRVEEFLRQIENPYCFKCGNMIVKSTFSSDDVTLTERFENYLRML